MFIEELNDLGMHVFSEENQPEEISAAKENDGKSGMAAWHGSILYTGSNTIAVTSRAIFPHSSHHKQ